MFEKNYFVNSPISNYENYRKKKFKFLARDIIKTSKITPENSILDFGCATGGLLKEFKDIGFKKLKGTDISYWAIRYGKKNLDLEKELDYYNVNLLANDYDIVLFLDVLEHVATWEISKMLLLLNNSSSKLKIIVRVPVATKEGENYFLEVSRNDVTHIQCHAKEWWQEKFSLYNFREVKRIVEKSIYDSKGVYTAVFEKEVRK